jgi:hypothetical protein
MANKYSDNWKDSWNPEDWQGRSKKQVEYSSKIIGIGISIFIVYILFSIFQ